MLRKDKELPDTVNAHINGKDWDDILHDIGFAKIHLGYRIIKKIYKITKCSLFSQLCNYYLFYVQYPYIFNNVVQYFLKFDSVVTTRMHGFILSTMLNISVTNIDTKYNKIINYINTWINKNE